MKKILLPLFAVFTLSGCQGTSKDVVDVTGKYVLQQSLTEVATEQNRSAQSTLVISKVAEQFAVEGQVYGDNFHVCHIASASEFEPGPLLLTAEEGKLVYRQVEPEYKINCRLELSFSAGKVQLSDENKDCANYVFSCGASVELDGVTLAK